MPELPEMENYKNLLNDLILNKEITNIEITREKSINIPVKDFILKVQHNKIIAIERRAKHLLFYLENRKVLLLHLMLGGWMFYGIEEERPNRTVQVKLSFGDHHLFFIGLRLGYLHLYTQDEVEKRLEDLGPEPMDPGFTSEQLMQILSNKGMLKVALTNQKFISGIGNCYSDEICFVAGILPTKRGKDLKEVEGEKLFQSMQNTLQEAIHYGGYMESPLFIGDKKTGGYDERCKVYDRENEPCICCGSIILKDIVSSKKTFYCKACQH